MTAAVNSPQQRTEQWLREHLLSADAALPFSFVYGGKFASELLAAWPRQHVSVELDAQRTQHTVSWAQPGGGLEVRCVATAYREFPVVEWTVYIKNGSAADSELLTEVRGLDVRVPEVEPGTSTVLHHTLGDTCGKDAFAPQRLPLERGAVHRFAPSGGRPTSMAFPYFNLEAAGPERSHGRIVALGWPGQWSAEFSRDEQNVIRVRSGQELVSCRLQSGETLRTPLSVQLFWQGTRAGSQNLWRRWMLALNLPRCDGKLHPPFSAQCMGCHQNAKDEIQFIDALVKNDAVLDYWWMDAGWWKEGFPITGNWEPDPVRFPQGIRAVADHAHANGMKLVLWFEPERVGPNMAWEKLGPWLLSIPPELRRERFDEAKSAPKFALDEAERNQIIVGDRLLNLGDPEARAFLRDFLSEKVTAWQIDFLRIDFNISPLAFWRHADAPDRRGLTENHYVSGWLTLLDELRARHPKLWIDTCASGGRRIDLETLRRTLPLLRSDYQFEPIGNQSHTPGIAAWIPFYGTGVFCDDVYEVRSSISALGGLGYQLNKPVDWKTFRARLAEWKKVAPFLLGDFYPLTEHTLNNDAWMAWQFNSPELNGGVIQIFRRAESPLEKARFKLHGLDPEAAYEVHDFDREGAVKYSGRELTERGLAWELPEARTAALILYTRVS